MNGGKHLTDWGKQCKAQMIFLGKSLADVTTETGFTRNYISSIINGRCIAPEDTVEKISKSLGVNPTLYK